MAKEYPYFKWFPKDAEADEKYSAMDDTELGFFHRCMNKSWMNEGIPADPEERARVLKTPLEIANELWKRVGRSFIESEMFPGKVVNPRQEIERRSAISKTLSARKAANAKHHPQGASEIPTYEPASANGAKNGHVNGHSPGSVIPLGKFENWWELWSSVRGTHHKQRAVQAWLSVVTSTIEVACIECTQSYIASLDDPSRGYNPDNFLYEQAKDGFRGRWPTAGKTNPSDKNQNRRNQVNEGAKMLRNMR